MIYRAPCRNYHGYCLVKIVGETKDVRGRDMVIVEALHGNPWDDASHGGWVPTNRRRFYPEHLTLNETTPADTEVESNLVAL
jgi:hypothetical protein